MSVTVTDFGVLPGGETVKRCTITNEKGASASFLTYGATWQEMKTPRRDGTLTDVVLGYDTLEEYLRGGAYLGATVGRVANRIRGGRFTLGGREYVITPAGDPDCCHSGASGFDKRNWKLQYDDESATFSLFSPDGDGGFPGNLSVEVTFALRDDGALSIRYLAVSDQDTLLNLTNHAYFNLRGQGNGNVLGETLSICSGSFTRVGPDIVPTGDIVPVEGTPLDFRAEKPIGQDIESRSESMDAARGYDHNFVLDRSVDGVEFFARAWDPEGGVQLEAYTDQPGVQLYTPYSLGGMRGKGGAVYGDHPAFCLETQHFADAVNHLNFPSIVLPAGDIFTSETIYRFTAK